MLTMEEAMKQSATRFAQGEIVKGTVIELRPKEVLVDIGYKSEGIIPLNEFLDAASLKVGDEVDVLIEKLENKEGTVVLSHEKGSSRKIGTTFCPSATKAASSRARSRPSSRAGWSSTSASRRFCRRRRLT